jgi:Fur family iron response transcriptional regulator
MDQRIMASTQKSRPYAQVLDRLKQVGLRPTRQRIALAKLLCDAGDCHFTAEQLHAKASAAGVRVSLATIYNTLHQFTHAGLLREIVVSPGSSYFDTNISDHHHFFYEGRGELSDIAGDDVVIASLPQPPSGTAVDRVDVIIRVKVR